MLEYPPTSGLVKRPAQVSLWGKKSIKIRSNKNSSRIKSWKTLSLINYQKTLKSKSKSKRPAEASLQGRKSNKKPLQTKLEYQLQIIKSVIKWHFKGRSSTWCGNFQPPHVIATPQVEMIIHNHHFDEKQTKSDNFVPFCHLDLKRALLPNQDYKTDGVCWLLWFEGKINLYNIFRTLFHSCQILSPLCCLSIFGVYLRNVYATKCFAQECVFLKTLFTSFHATVSRVVRWAYN